MVGRAIRPTKAERRTSNLPYRSGYEKRIAEDLKKRGIPFDYEPITLYYELRAGNACCSKCGSDSVVILRRYNPDFRISPNGKLNPKGSFILEAKGKFTSKDRTKMVAAIKANPHLKIRMIFMRDNKLNKNSKIRYSDWCRTEGIEFSMGIEVPENWL